MICRLLLLCLIFSTTICRVEARPWTNNKGQKIEAELHSATPREVILKLPNGKLFKTPLKSLSPADQAIVMNHLRSQSGQLGNKEPANYENWNARWPQRISGSVSPKITTLDKDAQGRYIYQSPHYEFISEARLSSAVVARFSILFESTRDYLAALPLSMAKTQSSKRHRILLFGTEQAYISNGGPPGSAGVYRPYSDDILIPLRSLGVKPAGKGWVIDHDAGGDKTLTHEIVHQLTDRQYFTYFTTGWFTEGLAEYIALTGYRAGQYNLLAQRRPMIAYVTGYGLDNEGGRNLGTEITLPPLKLWMTQNYGSFTRSAQVNYGSALLIFYYFANIDDNGQRKPLIAFCKQLKAGAKPDKAFAALLNNRSWDELEAAISRGLHSKGIKITFQK